ncbi:hypothetical protein [Gandjariella thermophila]|nr:hypothetical protein [Gandjariella thermophila]
MQTVEVATWIAAGVAIIAVGVAAWQLWLAHRRARQAEQLASRVRELTRATESHAEQAAGAAQGAHSHSRWAWEQVKLAANQLAEARQERRASTQREQWEWAYAMTTTARELVDCSQELIRVALDAQVAPHYRLAAERHYGQVCQWWQETVIKALARTSPTLELQHQVITFTGVHHRLHGHIGVLLRAAETNTVSDTDPLAKQAQQTGQELAGAHRHLQRAVSDSLTTNPESQDAATQRGTGSVARAATPTAPVANAPRRGLDGPRQGRSGQN